MDWRLTFDVPLDLATEPGFSKSVSYSQFKPDPEGFDSTWREPVTGLITLRPSFTEPNKLTLKRLSDFRYAPGFWGEGARGFGLPSSGGQPAYTGYPIPTSFLSAGQSPRSAAITALHQKPPIPQDNSKQDVLDWNLETNFLIPADTGWYVLYEDIADDRRDSENWLCFVWDNIAIHLSRTGRLTAWTYYSGATVTPSIFAERQFDLGPTGKGKHGMLVFLPIPGLGLVVHHFNDQYWRSVYSTDNDKRAVQGHLLKFPSRYMGGGKYRLIEASKLLIGRNTYTNIALVVGLITYPASGTFTDETVSLGYAPSVTYNALDSYQYLAHAAGSNTAISLSLVQSDGSNSWSPGDDRYLRVKATFATADSKYTPFLAGYRLAFPPVRTTRATTPVEPTTILRLEYSDDEWGRGEGSADVLMNGETLRKIAERGDATYQLEFREVGATEWRVWDGGFATDWKLEAPPWMPEPREPSGLVGGPGECWKATCTLTGMWKRLTETHVLLEAAFDGLSVGSAINLCLMGCGFAPISPLPTKAQTVMIPSLDDGKRWRWAPTLGQSAEEVVRTMLYHLRAQNEEWRLKYDFDDAKWVLEPKPRATPIWQLYTQSRYEDAVNRKWRCGSINVDVDPPEANIVLVEGATEPDTSGERLVSYDKNLASLTSATHPEYLGRTLLARVTAPALHTQEECDFWARTFGQAIMHRRMRAQIELPIAQLAIEPLSRIIVRNHDEELVLPLTLWVKRRTVLVENDRGDQTLERMTIEVDTVWAAEVAV